MSWSGRHHRNASDGLPEDEAMVSGEVGRDTRKVRRLVNSRWWEELVAECEVLQEKELRELCELVWGG